jgi:YD repeat-containing protein
LIHGRKKPGSVSVTRQYDGDDRLSSVSDWLSHTTQFAYDPNSNLTSEVYPNTITAGYHYNAADQLTTITDTENGTPLWTFGYSRDPLGQVQTATDPVGSFSHSYGYDQADGLQQREHLRHLRLQRRRSADGQDRQRHHQPGVGSGRGTADHDAGGASKYIGWNWSSWLEVWLQ